jgi:hypothetical protein
MKCYLFFFAAFFTDFLTAFFALFFFTDFFFAADFFFAGGTFAPALRASDKPIAMACLRLVTFFLLRPLFSLPFFMARISRSTAFPALGLYLRPLDFFLVGMLSTSRDWEAVKAMQVVSGIK